MKTFSLLRKSLSIFGFFAAFCLSCPPEITDPISISLSSSPNWRVNIQGGDLTSDKPLINWNSNVQPGYNEIYLFERATPAVPGVYEIIPFEHFYRATAIGNAGALFTIQFRNGAANQKFSIECNSCNLQTNSANWAQYHTLCLIKNVASGLCMSGLSGTASFNNVTQADCAIASNWDLFGRRPLDQNNVTSNSTTPVTPVAPTASSLPITTSNIQLSAGGLVGIIIGTTTVAILATLIIGYLFINRRQPITEKDRVNVQFYDQN